MEMMKLFPQFKHLFAIMEAQSILSHLQRQVAVSHIKQDAAIKRADDINDCAIKLVKFLQQVSQQQGDAQALMYIDLLKHYFLYAFDWNDLKAEDYKAFSRDALWFCDQMRDYLKQLERKK